MEFVRHININVDNQRHIIDARLQVRTLARDMGFNTMDQARVALATSTLAQLVGLDGRYKGSIGIGTTYEGPACLQIICKVVCDDMQNLKQKNAGLNQLRSMVDELKVDTVSDGLQITMIKKKANGRRS